MKEKAKRFWMNPWTVGIGTGVIMLFITITVDLITAATIFSALKNLAVAIWNGILTILNFELKAWWVLTGFVAVIVVLCIIVKHSESKPQQKNIPPFLDYTKAEILGYKWKWHWKENMNRKYTIEGLHPVCNKCETPLVDNLGGYGGHYKCLRCNEGYSKPMPELNHVEMMIRDNVRRKYFPNE